MMKGVLMWTNFKLYFLLFVFYSVLGWLIEVIIKSIQYKRFINRGFLIGPYCPIYGLGAFFMTILLKRYIDYPLLIFILGMLICAILEYSTSYFMEKIFKARWWDYSNNKYNLNGRICLNTMIPFGLLSLLMMYFINPFLLKIYNGINGEIVDVIIIAIMLLLLVDIVISVIILFSVRKTTKLLDKDNTEEMSKKVIEIIKSKGLLFKRLFYAFPNFKHISLKLIKKTKEKIIGKRVKNG